LPQLQIMEASRILERRWARACLIVMAWTLFGLFLTSQTALMFSRRSISVKVWRILLAEMAFAACWAALTPLVLYLAGKFPFERNQWRGSIFVHLVASALVGLVPRVVGAVAFIESPWESPGQMDFMKLLYSIFFFFDSGAMMYGRILLTASAVPYYRRYR